jgi:hypothetical protein
MRTRMGMRMKMKTFERKNSSSATTNWQAWTTMRMRMRRLQRKNPLV